MIYYCFFFNSSFFLRPLRSNAQNIWGLSDNFIVITTEPAERFKFKFIRISSNRSTFSFRWSVRLFAWMLAKCNWFGLVLHVLHAVVQVSQFCHLCDHRLCHLFSSSGCYSFKLNAACASALATQVGRNGLDFLLLFELARWSWFICNSIACYLDSRVIESGDRRKWPNLF